MSELSLDRTPALSSRSRRGCWLVIEPHFDDACFSYAGTMVVQRDSFDSLCILTIFSRSAYTTADYISSVIEGSVDEVISSAQKLKVYDLLQLSKRSRNPVICQKCFWGYSVTSSAPRDADQ